ncbi:Arc family DNA-binding protein [Vibrio sp. HN007]|uniref:Arc family DNA-binding protein n=1 Tax=Vibrio iocasae TaxID=3098914 RepID=UPI0035D52769
MSRDIAPFGLRMKSDLKEALDMQAKENKRSLNAEITSRLEGTISDTNNLFIPAEKAHQLVVESRAKVKERILIKTFQDIHEGIQKGVDIVYVNLDEFHLDEMSYELFEELLKPTLSKLSELGYQHDLFDLSVKVTLIEE